MKKIISCLLTAAILLSAIFTTSVMVTASEADGIVADIDFSEDFYSNSSAIVSYNADHGKAMYFSRISVASENWGNAQLIALGDDDGDLKLPAGTSLKVTFDFLTQMIPPATAGGTDYRDFSVGIMYLTDAELTAATADGGLRIYADKINYITTIPGALSSDWESKEAEVTISEYAEDAKAYMVLYGNYQTGFSVTKIWFDNIVFKENNTVTDPTDPTEEAFADIDFSEEYYSSNPKVKLYNGAYGKALLFDRVSHISADWGTAVMWPLGNDDGDLKLTAGKKFEVSFDIIKNKIDTQNAGDSGFSVGIIYLNDNEIIDARDAQNGGLAAYADRMMKLVDIDSTISTGWENETGEIGVYSYAADAKAYLVLYADYQTSFANTEIWIDNMVFKNKEVALGDVDDDGVINATDLTILRKALFGYQENMFLLVDVNNDNVFNILDLIAIKKLLV